MSVRRAIPLVAVLALLLQLFAVGVASAQTAHVEAVDFDFRPRHLEVRPGTEVIWTNTGREPHTVTAIDGSFDFAINPGESGSHTFTDDGDNPYYCKFHAEVDPESGQAFGMTGTVTVGERRLESTNLEAPDNVGTSIAWSQQGFADGSTPIAFLGRADLFADSLSSGGAQGQGNAPLLLTPQTTLDARVRAELDRLGVRTVHILGGPNAIAPNVEQELRSAGFGTHRVAGADRVATAVDVAESFFPGPRAAIIARGWGNGDPTQAWVDSLGAGAFASIQNIPVLLTRTEALSGDTREYFEGAGRTIETVFIAGGPAAVSEAVVDELEQLGVEVVRLGGRNRVETSIILAFMSSPEGPPAGVSVVDGAHTNAWADGFAAASREQPVLLSMGDELSPQVAGLLAFAGAVDVVCGTTVSAEACRQATAAAHFGDFPPSEDMIFALVEGQGPPGYVIARPAGGALCLSTVAFDAVTGVEVTKGGQTVAQVGDPGLSQLPGLEWLTDLYGCDFGLTDAQVQDLQANPETFEVTMTYAEGQVSGSFTELTAFMLAGLSGDQEIDPDTGEPGAGAEDAIGFQAVLGTSNPDELCVIGFYIGIDTPQAAHIHEGERGENGPAVFTLPTPEEFEPGFAAMLPQCLTEADAEADPGTVEAIKANPESHYVNIHTEEFPGGAIRGQLFSLLEARGGSEAAATFQSTARSYSATGASTPSWVQRFTR